MDSKNRVLIPSKWRDQIGSQLVLSPGYEGAIELRSKSSFLESVKAFTSEDSLNQHIRTLKRRFLGSSHEVVLDKWHRFAIPQSFLKQKNYTKGLILRGNGDSIEIWSPEEYKAWDSNSDNSLEIAAKKIKESNLSS